MSVYVARYCVENVVCVEDLTETLEDLMDEEFDTVCHDNSPQGKLCFQVCPSLQENSNCVY